MSDKFVQRMFLPGYFAFYAISPATRGKDLPHNPYFGQQNPELWPRSWKLNGNIFFELFLSDLDEKKENRNELIW